MYVSRKILLTMLVVLLASGAALYWFVTSHGFSAREKPTSYEAWLARRARSLATEPGSRDLKNPVVATPLNVAEARDHFADHCAVCHANNGSGETTMGRNMYPPAPDMRKSDTQNLTDGERFTSSGTEYDSPECPSGEVKMTRTGNLCTSFGGFRN